MTDLWNVFDGLTDAEAEELIRNQREYEEQELAGYEAAKERGRWLIG